MLFNPRYRGSFTSQSNVTKHRSSPYCTNTRCSNQFHFGIKRTVNVNNIKVPDDKCYNFSTAVLLPAFKKTINFGYQ
ncbi:hypothetical protein OIU76_005412 [Salix suchowensis]|nr:hypothetical protein OIU76_005412 [Salix suchowensis]